MQQKGRIRHPSLEQSPVPPERLPRLVPPPAVVSPMAVPCRRHQLSESQAFVSRSPHQRPQPVRRISDDDSSRKERFPSEQMSSPSPGVRPLRWKNLQPSYEPNNTYTGSSADARRVWINNLPSVTSGVAVNDFGEETWTSGDAVEKRKLMNFKEFRQRHRERRDTRNYSASEQDAEVTPLRSSNLSNSTDSKSHHVGRFVVLKAAVANNNEDTPGAISADDSALASATGHQANTEMSVPGPPENHYWTVSGGKGVLLTAPGARRFDDSRPSGGGRSVHNRFRQFFVENLRSSRLRTHSEQQQSQQGGSSGGNSRIGLPLVDSPNKLKPTAKYGAGLPPHAHTITAGTGSAVARALFQSNQRAKDDGSIAGGEASTGTSGLSSSPVHGQYPSTSLNSVNDSDGTGSRKGSRRRLKSTHKMVKKLLKLSSGPKKQIEYSGELPDPSKLPREIPQSSLEFTQSRLKNVPRRSATSSRQGGSGNQGEFIPRVLVPGEAKSEELLLSAFSRSISASSSHASSRHSHDHHHHHHHHHHKHHHHDTSSNHPQHNNPTTLTRVTENRRYLMFTKASPFRSPHEFMQTRGRGLSETEVYTILFRHTTCYELMPESAKLVTLDSMLPVGKAFRALCVNGIRAAPVWDSESQSFMGMLTINDFLEMLTYFWRRAISGGGDGTSSDSVEVLESTSIKKWKEIRSKSRSRQPSGPDQEKAIMEAENEDYEGASSQGSRSRCNSSSSSSSSSTSSSCSSSFDSRSRKDADADADDADSNSVASAPSQLGESKAAKAPAATTKGATQNSRPSRPRHRIGVSGKHDCDCRAHGGGGKCSVRMKYHRMDGLTIAYPDDSLYSALRLLAHCKLHRLPVFDDPVYGTGNPLFVLTHRSLLAYLYKKQIVLPKPAYLQTPLREARVGTWGSSLALVQPSTRLVDALAFFEDERVSVLPVVDSLFSRRLLDIFAKFDVITLILAGKHKKPDMTVQDVLDICKQIHQGVIPIPEGKNRFDVEICRATDTIQFVFNKLMRTGYHRMIIVDDSEPCRVEGVVSISDLLYYMVLRPSPRGPTPFSGQTKAPAGDSTNAAATATAPKKSRCNAADLASPDWLFYSEEDPDAMQRKPCVPIVKDELQKKQPSSGGNNGTNREEGNAAALAARSARNRLRVTSDGSVTTSSRSSSTESSSSSSSTYSSNSSSSSDSSTSSSSSSASSGSSSVSTVSREEATRRPNRARAQQQQTVRRPAAGGSGAAAVDSRRSNEGKSRTKTNSS